MATAAAVACLFTAAAVAQDDQGQQAAQDAQTADAPVMYSLARIDPPPGYRGLYLEAINNHGDAAGYATQRYRAKGYVVIRLVDGTFRYLSRPQGCLKRQFAKILRFNDQGQLLMAGCGAASGWFWGPRSKWTPIRIGGYSLTMGGMNDDGEVVGTATDSQGHKFGFVWKQSTGDYKLFSEDGGYSFAAINDHLKIAADVTHVPDPKLPYDRSGVSAALVRHSDKKMPLYTGDFNIQTLAEYEDPAHWDYHVNSHAVAINEDGALALTSPKSFTNYYDTMGCRWQTKEKRMHCFRGAGRGSSAVAIDGAGDVFIATHNKNRQSYVMLPDGTTYPLGAVTNPVEGLRSISVMSASESGFVAGYFNYRSGISFILTPVN